MKNICDWNNCKEIGEYKAPIEKDNSCLLYTSDAADD